MSDEADKNTFLQQYRDMLRYIMCHRKVISYINCLTFWSTVVGFLSSTFLGFEVPNGRGGPRQTKNCVWNIGIYFSSNYCPKGNTMDSTSF